MDERAIMEDLLNVTKGTCDLYMHGTIESSTDSVHSAFSSALSEALEMQNEIYTKMAGKGWYSTQQAEQQKIDQVKQKYSSKS